MLWVYCQDANACALKFTFSGCSKFEENCVGIDGNPRV